MNTIITIPPTTKESRIGSVFGNVISVLYSTEQTDFAQAERIVWDFSGCSSLHPFYLGALSVLIHQYGNKILIGGLSDSLDRFFQSVNFTAPLEVNHDIEFDIDSIFDGGQPFSPMCKFNPTEQCASDKTQWIIEETLKAQIGQQPKLHTIISYILGELVDNISEHSGADIAFIYSEYSPQEEMIYLFISDKGKSIYTSYATDERYAAMLTQQESSAMSLALRGKSTKNLPGAENRGYGISRTRKILVEALDGAFFVLSGGVFFGHEQGTGDTIVDLPEEVRWDGTAVLLKIPTKIPDDFNIYDYIS